MRARIFFYSALLFLVSTLSTQVMAQFQQPTAEELKLLCAHQAADGKRQEPGHS